MNGFTPREQEISELLLKNKKPIDIAQELMLSPQTVYVHLRNIAAKLRLDSRSCSVIRLALIKKIPNPKK